MACYGMLHRASELATSYEHGNEPSGLDEGEWSASRLGCFTPRKRAPGTHWIGGWVGRRAFLDAVVEIKIPSPRRESKPRTPIVVVVIITTYPIGTRGSFPGGKAAGV
jgi:hypothetical protein